MSNKKKNSGSQSDKLLKSILLATAILNLVKAIIDLICKLLD